jgi:hypothetical protein
MGLMKNACMSVVWLVSMAAGHAAPPNKSTSSGFAVVVDGAGAEVGPVIPVADATKYRTAALFRFNGVSIKALFTSATGFSTRLAAASQGTLTLASPVKIYFPTNYGCTGEGYVQDTDYATGDAAPYTPTRVAEELRGFASMYLVPAWPATGIAKPVVVSVDWSAPVMLPGFSGSVMLADGTCSYGVAVATTSANGTLYPVRLVGQTSYNGTYSVK